MLDATGEVANMIVGNVKNELEDHIGHIEIGVPAVAIVPKAQRAADTLGLSAVRFRCSGSVFSVGISFQDAVTGGNPCWNREDRSYHLSARLSRGKNKSNPAGFGGKRKLL